MEEKGLFSFENGSEVICDLTGYRGKITGRVNYVSGTNQYKVETLVGGKIHTEWLDEENITLASDKT